MRFVVLDSFRGIAALFVVLFHMHYVDSMTDCKFIRNSYLFVEFFFVLSGFVLTHSYAFKSVGFKSFFISRTFRLMPLHVFMLGVFVCLEIAKLFAQMGGNSFNNAAFTNMNSIDEILPNLFLLQSWLPFVEPLSWNYPSWSISVEYYVYMIFFATLLWKKFRYLAWLTISFVAFLCIFEQSEFLKDALRGLSCFFMGALVYVLYVKFHQQISKMSHFVFLLLELAVLSVAFCIMQTPKFDHQAILASVIFALTIFIFSFEKGFISKMLKGYIFQLLGRLSYSIYMVHAAVLFVSLGVFMVLEKMLGRKLMFMIEKVRYVDLGSVLANNLMVVFVIFIVLIFSYMAHKTIEVKGQKVGKKLIKKFS